MDTTLSRNWWALVLRGVIGVAFGVMALTWPGMTWLVLTLFFGAYIFVDGVFALVSAFSGESHARNWWSLIVEGVLGVLVGAITFFWPGITALTLLYLVAFWAIATGAFEIATAIRLRREIEGEWALALAGVVSLLLGLAILIMPLAGLLTVVWLIAAYAIAFGTLLIVAGLRLRSRIGAVG